MSDNYNETLGNALAAVKETETVQDDGYIHLSSGVILAPKKISPFAFQSVAMQFKDPPVPSVYIEEKGRDEPNPMHPAYLKELEEVNTRRSMATIDAVIALGTKLVFIPDGFPTPDEDDWLEDLETVGIIIDRNNARLRYRTWVKYIAGPTVEDIQLTIAKVLKSIGVTEGAVAEATVNFQHPS